MAMAIRPVFTVINNKPVEVQIKFDYNRGFAIVQHQKNIKAIYENFISKFPDKNVLEISSKTMQNDGKDLSAFFLKVYVPSLGREVELEKVFQASKTFEADGPYTDLMNEDVTCKDAKGDPRLKSSGRITGFKFEGKEYVSNPTTSFYDYLYVNAVRRNEKLHNILISYDSFTDIAFNPKKSINCQAKAAALYVALYRNGLLDKCYDYDEFVNLEKQFPITAYLTASTPRPTPASRPAPAPTPVIEEPSVPIPEINEDTVFVHKIWGKGKGKLSPDGKYLEVNFGGKPTQFPFPMCIQKGFLTVEE